MSERERKREKEGNVLVWSISQTCQTGKVVDFMRDPVVVRWDKGKKRNMKL